MVMVRRRGWFVLLFLFVLLVGCVLSTKPMELMPADNTLDCQRKHLSARAFYWTNHARWMKKYKGEWIGVWERDVIGPKDNYQSIVSSLNMDDMLNDLFCPYVAKVRLNAQ